jgi:hypothetical protein
MLRYTARRARHELPQMNIRTFRLASRQDITDYGMHRDIILLFYA